MGERHSSSGSACLLDLNHYIQLAKAHRAAEGHTSESGRTIKVLPGYPDLLDAARRAKAEGRAVFPLSEVHFMEVAHSVPSPRQRGHVADVIEELSDFTYLLGRPFLVQLEITAGLDKIYGTPPSYVPVPLLGSSALWTLDGAAASGSSTRSPARASKPMSARPENRRRCCAIGACCHQVASEWTRHQAWTVLQSALSAAIREELLTRNVAALVRVPVPWPKRAKAWTAERSRQFLESARADDDPLYAAYVLILVLGLRCGELLGLAWEDVDLGEATAWIGWQLQLVNGGLVRRATITYASDAPLPLPDICIRALEHRRQVEARYRSVAPAWHESGLVLTTRLGTPVEPRNFHRTFVERTKRAGVPVTPVHLTRKACASLLVAMDVHPRVAMQILRRSKIAVTMEVYAEVVSSSTKDALRRLGEQLKTVDPA